MLRASSLKRWLYDFVKLLITIFILWLLFRRIDLSKVSNTLLNVRIYYFLAGLGAYLLGIGFSAKRWQMFLAHLGFKYSLSRLFKIYLKSLFIASFLPSGGLDVVRMLFLGKKEIVSNFSSTFMDRFSGFIVINIYVFAGIMFNLKRFGEYMLYAVIFLLFQLSFLTLLFLPIGERVFKLFKSYPYLNKVYEIYRVLHSFREKSLLFKALIYSFLIQFSFSLDVFFLILSTGNHVNLFYCSLFVPFINFLLMLPITFAGFGIREGGFVMVFKGFLEQAVAISVSFLYYITGLIAGLIGGILLLFERYL